MLLSCLFSNVQLRWSLWGLSKQDRRQDGSGTLFKVAYFCSCYILLSFWQYIYHSYHSTWHCCLSVAILHNYYCLVDTGCWLHECYAFALLPCIKPLFATHPLLYYMPAVVLPTQLHTHCYAIHVYYSITCLPFYYYATCLLLYYMPTFLLHTHGFYHSITCLDMVTLPVYYSITCPSFYCVHMVTLPVYYSITFLLRRHGYATCLLLYYLSVA